jgi:hypothetical protein
LGKLVGGREGVWSGRNCLYGSGFTLALSKSGDAGLIGFALAGIGDAILATDRGVKRGTDNLGTDCGWGDCRDDDLGRDSDWLRGFARDLKLSFGQDDDARNENTDYEEDRENDPKCFFTV